MSKLLARFLVVALLVALGTLSGPWMAASTATAPGVHETDGILLGPQASGHLESVAAVSAGGMHSCALKTNGTVWCWGNDRNRELGDGTHGGPGGNRLKPVQVVQGSGHLGTVAAITAGQYHTCALKTDGTVWCWGAADQGQLGDGTRGGPEQPVQVVQGSGHLGSVAAISAGAIHTCALKTDGTVWCWGSDFVGQLGDGTTGNADYDGRLIPVQVVQGSGHLGSVAAIAAGAYHTCALKFDGTVWCWGLAAEGELGDGTRGGPGHCGPECDRLRPAQVVQPSGQPGHLGSVAAISAGSAHTCALKTDRTVWCWGGDFSGQLGHGGRGGPEHLRLRPVQVVQPSGHAGNLGSVTAIGAGWSHTCALKANGTVWCWGEDLRGQLGDGTRGDRPGWARLRPVQVVQGSGHLGSVAGIATGDWHTCAVKTDGSAWCWGLDENGQLGDGTTGSANNGLRLTPVQVIAP